MFHCCAEKLKQNNYKRELSADGKTILSLSSISCCFLPVWSCKWNLLQCPWYVISALWSGSNNSVMAAHFCLAYGKSVLKIKCALRLSLQPSSDMFVCPINCQQLPSHKHAHSRSSCEMSLLPSGFKESCVLDRVRWNCTYGPNSSCIETGGQSEVIAALVANF